MRNLAISALVIGCVGIPKVFELHNGVGLTPQMGWNLMEQV